MLDVFVTAWFELEAKGKRRQFILSQQASKKQQA